MGSAGNQWGNVDMDFSDEFLVNNHIPVFSERLIYSSVIVIGGAFPPVFLTPSPYGHSSPAFCNAKYRGRWHIVTEGLKNIRNRENVSRYQPSPPMCRKEI